MYACKRPVRRAAFSVRIFSALTARKLAYMWSTVSDKNTAQTASGEPAQSGSVKSLEFTCASQPASLACFKLYSLAYSF